MKLRGRRPGMVNRMRLRRVEGPVRRVERRSSHVERGIQGSECDMSCCPGVPVLGTADIPLRFQRVSRTKHTPDSKTPPPAL